MPSNPFKSPKAPKAPEPVDPRVAINAEARANRFNVVGPHGRVTWSGQPETGMTQTTQLSPSGQRQLTRQNRVAEAMLTAGQRTSNRLQTPFSFNDQGRRVANAVWEREKAYLDPERDRQFGQMEQRLANMGLPMGSEAYGEESRRFDQNWNDAYAQAARTAQLTGADLAQRQRMQQFNEIASLMGYQPHVPNAPAAPIDVGGAYARQQAGQNLQYQGQLAGYNADVASQNSMMGGLMGLGGQLGAAYLLGCDRALKWAIRETGRVIGGLKLYVFKYLGSLSDHVGFMADEVEAINPSAVVVSPLGFKQVSYGSIFA